MKPSDTLSLHITQNIRTDATTCQSNSSKHSYAKNKHTNPHAQPHNRRTTTLQKTKTKITKRKQTSNRRPTQTVLKLTLYANTFWQTKVK
ncbi:hypothetical protein HMPREF1991_00055 [Hoylesella loescheii DSM 19665 = JCM 12249 = ATCC 15930]|uniref:Uncharacterized protein n=1 Tax=Hoylesella loescheii DSM 19665 = JCM 12249 = ATCC 15930 TaxID=1122985 RepID=A0A069QM47_HOYLO|nr:hypothetical protein HMPREF1991_00055 [Hoylesella loescheii DSM 19665 = JCM 12249 = ATCC 15930]